MGRQWQWIVVVALMVCTQGSAQALVVPKELGTIKQKVDVEGSSYPQVYVIEDAHCHAEVQNNIAGIIEQAIMTGARVYAGVEGGFYGTIDTSTLSIYKDRAQNEAYVRSLFEKGSASGVEYLHYMKGGFVFFGIEDRATYVKNLQRYQEYITQGDEQKADLDKVQSVLTDIADITLPYEYKNFSEAYDRFVTNKDLDFLLQLRSLLMIYGIAIDPRSTLQKFNEIELNYAKLDAQRLKLQTRLFNEKTGLSIDERSSLKAVGKEFKAQLDQYIDLKKSLVLMAMIEDLDFEALVKDVNRVKAALEDRMLDAEEEKEVLYHVRMTDVTEKLLTLQLTPDDYTRYAAELPADYFDQLLAFIHTFSPTFTLSLSYVELFKSREDFYRLARERDVVLARNTFRFITENALTAKDIVFVVIGGFHSAGFCASLEQQGLPYALIRPRITDASGEAHEKYFRVLKELTVDPASIAQ